MTTAFGPQGPNFATSRPAITADVSGGADTWFVDCSAQGATNGTYVTSDFFNVIVDQLRTLVRTAGVTLDKTNSAMLYNAVRAACWSDANCPAYMAGNGYQRLSNGLILQWGLGTWPAAPSVTASSISVTFPLAFPNAVFSISGSAADNAHPTNGYPPGFSAQYRTLSGFMAAGDMLGGSSGLFKFLNNVPFTWTAIGH